MREPIRLGSQLFINKDDSPEYVRRMVVKMKENGLEIIRLFMVWEQLEPQEGNWIFDNYDACFEQAAISGLTIVPTLMSVSPPGWMQLTNGPQSLADLDDPLYQQASKLYIQRVVNRYKEYKNLDSWILWNEPSRVIYKTPHAIRAFSQYLQKIYGSIEAYNKASFRQYKSFDDLETGMFRANDSYEQPFKSFAEQLDWLRFTVDNLERQLCIIRDEIKKYDNQHPIHVNPHNLQMDMQGAGQSIWRESELVDFLGCSAHPMWHSLRFPERRWSQSVSFFSDLMKSATRHPERKFWVTELQGGTTLYSSERPFTPKCEHIRHWIWEGIGSGAKAVVFWCFNARNAGYEAGEWSLLNQLEQPSARLDAVKEISSFIKRYETVFEHATPVSGKVMLFYSEQSMALGQVEGDGQDPLNPRNSNMYMDAMTGAYLIFSDLSIPVDMINEERLIEGGIPEDVEVLVLPNTIVLGEQEFNQIARFIQSGGTVIADGLTGMKDRNGKLNEHILVRISELFGAAVEDIETDDENMELITNNDMVEGWFYRLPLLLDPQANLLAKFYDGKPAVSERKYGDGRAIRIGTNLFQKYFAQPNNEILKFVKQIMNFGHVEDVILINPDAKLRMKKLNHPEGKIVIFINEGNATRVNLILRSKGEWLDMAVGTSMQVNVENQSHEFDVAAKEVRVFFYKFK
jgi:beta-galactosidase GanA